MLLESSTPLDGLPSFGNPGPFTEFSRYRLSEIDKQPLVKYRELLGYVAVPFDLPDIVFATPGADTKPASDDSSGPDFIDSIFTRRVFATVDVSLPPPPRGGGEWETSLVAENQPQMLCVGGCPETGVPNGDSHQRIFAYAPGVYYLVLSPTHTQFQTMSGDDYARLIRKGRRVVITRGGPLSVDLRTPAGPETK
jgi:hypothetical protein